MTSTQSVEAVTHVSERVEARYGGTVSTIRLKYPHGNSGLCSIGTYPLCLTDKPFMGLLFKFSDEPICKDVFPLNNSFDIAAYNLLCYVYSIFTSI